MKKTFLRKLMSGILMLTLTFGIGVSATQKNYKISDFPNVLDAQSRLTNTPYGYYQVSNFTTFMDNGSWHGYGLPSLDDKTNLGGFAGPTILFESVSESIALNLSDCFNKIKYTIKKNLC